MHNQREWPGYGAPMKRVCHMTLHAVRLQCRFALASIVIFALFGLGLMVIYLVPFLSGHSASLDQFVVAGLAAMLTATPMMALLGAIRAVVHHLDTLETELAQFVENQSPETASQLAEFLRESRKTEPFLGPRVR